ncbi:MAG: AAA family ATPase [Bacteroidota bacterium]
MKNTTIESGIKLYQEILSITPKADQYILDTPLRKAVETALRFNQPLLLTGEPGTGKTQLAYKVARLLHEQTKGEYLEEPLRFNTKTTSQARDLFYLYDAISHFQQANLRNLIDNSSSVRPISDFIELQALGRAITLANPKPDYTEKFKYKTPEKAHSSVVLIDEVDKAPRDFTNDILNEIENREFYVKEQDNYRVELGKENKSRILLIMTSNSEKNLPEAFLRRCIFYHIPTPGPERMREILKAHLSVLNPTIEKSLDSITNEFEVLRSKVTRKQPATAELVALVKLLEMENLFDKEIKNVKSVFRENLSLLVKTREDIEALREYFSEEIQ